MKSISIIIPAYNSEHSIGKVLSALEKQDYPNYEVIVVDDNSKYKTTEVAKAYPNFKLIRNEKNLGITKSVNRGIKESNGEIIISLHDDCVPLSNSWVSDMVKTFELDPKIAVVSSQFLIRFKELDLWSKCLSFAYFLGDDADLVDREEVRE